MKAYVVDTNVPVVANGEAPQADPDCRLACVEALQEVVDAGVIVLDDAGTIIEEYRRYLSPSGQPGVGDRFMKWVWIHQAVAARCEVVHVDPLPGDGQDFEQFPRDAALTRFDRADRKFAAVARQSAKRPIVLNAVDSDWWEYRRALAAHGVRIRFVCPNRWA